MTPKQLDLKLKTLLKEIKKNKIARYIAISNEIRKLKWEIKVTGEQLDYSPDDHAVAQEYANKKAHLKRLLDKKEEIEGEFYDKNN